MMPMMMPPAQAIAEILGPASGPIKVLDIAAGHGIFGIVVAQKNPQAEIVASDWAGVLRVATENAGKMGVAARHKALPGDAFKVDWGTGYDVALMTNFLHHFDADDLHDAAEEGRGGAEAGRPHRGPGVRAERRSRHASWGSDVRDADARRHAVRRRLHAR